MDPVTGLAALAGITLASVAGLHLKKRAAQQEGFDALPDAETGYRQSVEESQSRYNMFSGMVNPITNAIIPVGSSDTLQKQQKDLVKATLGSYSAEFDPSSKETVVLKKFENQFKPRADGSKSLFGAAKFCRQAGAGTQPFTLYNSDGTVKVPGAVDPVAGWKFDEICGVCFTGGIDEEGNIFKEKQRGMLVEPGMREDAYQEQQDNGWSYPRVGPSVGTCNLAPNAPVFATNAVDMARYRSRLDCDEKKQLGGADNCAVCYDTTTYSSVPPDTEKAEVELRIQGTGSVSVKKASSEYPMTQTLEETGTNLFSLGVPQEGETFTIDVTPVPGKEAKTNVFGYLFSTTPRGGTFTMPLNLIVNVDDETGAVPKKSGFSTFEDAGVEVAKMVPGTGKTKMRLRGTIPFTFVGGATFAAMDCLDGPYQSKSTSLSAFATDQPCFAKGSKPGSYNDACLRARILDAGCTNAGDLYKNPQSLNTKNGAVQDLQKIYATLQEIANNDMVDPVATKQCSGRTIETPCDPFILRQGTLKFGDALNGSATAQAQANQCLSYLYKNLGANEIAKPPRVGPTYNVWSLFSNNNKDQKKLICLPEGALNPDTNTNGKQTLIRVADQGYAGKIGVDAIKQYLTDQLNLAADTNRNANTDPERKAAIINCFGKNLTPLAVAQTGNPTVIQNACGVLAQYVRILPSLSLSPGEQYVELSQVAVIDKTGKNVAIGKSTAGSSPAYTAAASLGIRDATGAIDGQLYAKSRAFYISQIPGASSQFVLNLGAPTDITKIIVWTRGDGQGGSWYRKQGMRLQLLDANQNVLDQKLLNSAVQEEVTYLQQGADTGCKSALDQPPPLQVPSGMTMGLYVRFYEIADANPDLVPGNRGWGNRIGTPNAYGKLEFNQGTLPRSTNIAVIAKGYYIASGPETLYVATDSDDGIYVEFNGKQVIKNWTVHGLTRDTSAPIQIPAAGVYPFELRFYQGGWVGQLNFFYKINDQANWKTDLTERFAYRKAEVEQEDADYAAKIRAQQQAAAALAAQQAQTSTRITISMPDGRTIKNDNGTLRLNRGSPVTFDLVKRGDLYKASTSLALQISGTQSFLRHAGLVGYAHPFTANNGDFAWQIFPQGAGYLLKNEFGYTGGRWLGFGNPGVGSYLGYDAGSDTLRLMSYTTPSAWIAWKFSPLPSSSFLSR